MAVATHPPQTTTAQGTTRRSGREPRGPAGLGIAVLLATTFVGYTILIFFDLVFLAALLATIPVAIIFLIFQRYFVRGATEGAEKG
jgi:ABC-type maltose transport system permease subunit